jgi:tRNA(adenine34) deaminase
MNKEFMYRALKLAKTAAQQGDLPVGAVLVNNGEIIGEGLSRRENSGDPTAHAEIGAIRMGAKTLGSWHLDDCELYVTLEPCPMRAGAIINSRVKTVNFGAFEPKTGSCCNDSVINLFNLPYNHRPEVYGGICEKECAAVMTDFFKEKR